jgi:hypothetical protein
MKALTLYKQYALTSEKKKTKAGVEAYTCGPSNTGGRDKRTTK